MTFYWPVTYINTHPTYFFKVVYLLDVTRLSCFQLRNVPVLISALLEEGWGAHFKPSKGTTCKVLRVVFWLCFNSLSHLTKHLKSGAGEHPITTMK